MNGKIVYPLSEIDSGQEPLSIEFCICVVCHVYKSLSCVTNRLSNWGNQSPLPPCYKAVIEKEGNWLSSMTGTQKSQ